MSAELVNYPPLPIHMLYQGRVGYRDPAHPHTTWLLSHCDPVQNKDMVWDDKYNWKLKMVVIPHIWLLSYDCSKSTFVMVKSYVVHLFWGDFFIRVWSMYDIEQIFPLYISSLIIHSSWLSLPLHHAGYNYRPTIHEFSKFSPCYPLAI